MVTIRPKVYTVLKAFDEAPKGQNNLENYDKVKISLSKGNALRDKGTIGGTMAEPETLVCVAPLTEPFKFQANPQYGTFGDIIQKIDTLPGGALMSNIRGMGDAGTMSGARETYFGRIESAKLFKGVNDISYNFNFVCYEDLNRDGTPKTNSNTNVGSSIIPFLVFSSLSFPNMPANFMERLQDIFESFSQGGGAGFFSSIGGLISGGVQALGMQVNAAATGTKQFFKTIFGEVDKDAKFPSDVFAQKTKNCLDIEVSNICTLQNMIIKDFNATFSKEILASGLPVYTKYSLSVEPNVQPTNNEIQQRYFSNLYGMAGYDANNYINNVEMNIQGNVNDAMAANGTGNPTNPPNKQ